MDNGVEPACALLMFQKAVPRRPHTEAVGQATCGTSCEVDLIWSGTQTKECPPWAETLRATMTQGQGSC